jgi:SAM-dependent methyltransferase
MKNVLHKVSLILHLVISKIIKILIVVFFRKKIINKYLLSHSTTCLHLGCGSRNFKDWLNVDILQSPSAYLFSKPKVLPLDIRKPLPFLNDSFDFVYSEHVHEHLTYKDGVNLVSEVKRVLKPGGTFRLSIPNVNLFLGLFNRILGEEEGLVFEKACEVMGVNFRSEPKAPISLLNELIRDKGHKYIYDYDTIYAQLIKSGFSVVTRKVPGHSDIHILNNLESNLFGRKNDPLLLKFALWHTLTLEAVK